MEKTKRYLSIYEQVREDIISGRYTVGSKLPSKRVMAESMGVSVITVEHAYELLMEEGYITTREKSGYFVIFDDKDIYTPAVTMPIVRVKSEKKNNSQKIDFSYSIYAKTVRRVLSEYDSYIMEKSDKKGLLQLRTALCEYLGRSRRISVTPKQIIVGAGAEYLYGLIVQTFGREITYGIETPSYPKITKVYASGGAKLESLPLTNDGIDSKDLWAGHMNVLHITPYRSFPSGVTASASKKREYLKWSKKTDGYIIEDDFESEFTPSRKPEETLFSIDTEGRVIYVNTFTRTIGSFIRCAYMVLPTNLLPLFEEKIGFYECPVPTLDQLVLSELINSGDFERHINRVRRHNRKDKS
ncbi:PLP-dependent aminotransferase family protein [Butyrivibrio proteoclasticus]|uniref:MocR-like pyridoxine biosynthesis transcription factor PdxR n=1 Tax=Butyrivibrio proteoclasticus TaxID=43305 RepID=UPI00047E11FE|nr:PLP-dependent aminotransferase family protein [Butyrivibrio proteoclasticus]